MKKIIFVFIVMLCLAAAMIVLANTISKLFKAEEGQRTTQVTALTQCRLG